MIVRRFNQEGINTFRTFLAKGRDNPSTAVPLELLEDGKLSSIIEQEMVVVPRSLRRKADAAHYLECVLEPVPDTELAEDAGLWTWLTLFFFEEVCPIRSGKRVVRNDYHYVYEPKNARHSYRHLLFVSWQVLRVAGDHNRLFLGSPLSTLDTVTTEVMKRLFLTRIPCIFEVLDRLYWDEKRGRAKPGIVGTRPPKPGDLTHRLPLRIRQLEKTYDLLSLSADHLIELLGDEFRPYAAGGNSQQRLSLE